ncbi:MAG: bacillithiol biosynthesis cysteine-adding enzyme BshC [Bacteroidetes bacterium]|nr:MAG: bacillithiol biosynthesis cysteine-adding enzyme BshC [Bacteroidota bacterium]
MISFNKTTISLSKTGIFDRLILDYLENDPKTRDYYEIRPDIDALQQGLKIQNSRKINRPLLVEVLKEQYAFLDSPQDQQSVFSSIDHLLNDDVYTVCTGHQLNLFTGPLYTIYKIISTIKTAHNLSERSGKKVIPVYWMASEDHDMDEIDHLYIYGQRYVWPVEWDGPSGKSSCHGIQPLIDQLREKFGNSEEAIHWLKILESSYRPEYSLARATRNFLHSLFGHYGLLILDADEARLKNEFVPAMLDDINKHLVEKSVGSTVDQMSENYKIQVHPRSVNLFYLSDNKRIRIDFESGQFKLQNGSKTWNRTDLSSEIENHPERFSPNVLLRPLYQEMTLPNIAIVGGPAEIAYWLELKSLFLNSGVNFPALILRNSVMFLDSQILAKMEKFKLSTSNLFETADEWIRNYIKNGPVEDFSVDSSLNDISHIITDLSRKVEHIDPTIVGSLAAELSRIQKSLKSIEEKVIRSIKKKNETEITQLQKLHDKLFPHGKLQERTENILPFLFKYGRTFIDELMSSLDPFSNQLIILKEKSVEQKSEPANSLH